MKFFAGVLCVLAVAASLPSCTTINGYLRPLDSNAVDSIDSVNNANADSGTAYQGPVTNNYQPDSSNSTWTYQVSEVWDVANSTLAQGDPGAASLFSGYDLDTTIQYHVQSLGTSSESGGLDFFNFSNDYWSGLYAPAVAQAGGNYFGTNVIWEVLWLSGGSFGGFTLNNDTLAYLEVGQPAGTSWNAQDIEMVGGLADTVNLTFTVKAAGFSKAVNKVIYGNVVQIESKTTPGVFQAYAGYPGLGNLDLSITTEYFYAENVGLIEEDLSEPFMGITIKTSLQNSTIQ